MNLALNLVILFVCLRLIAGFIVDHRYFHCFVELFKIFKKFDDFFIKKNIKGETFSEEKIEGLFRTSKQKNALFFFFLIW